MSSMHLSRVESPVTLILTSSLLAVLMSTLEGLALVGVAGVGVMDAFRAVTRVRKDIHCRDIKTYIELIFH